jgi:hypothetical protein
MQMVTAVHLEMLVEHTIGSPSGVDNVANGDLANFLVVSHRGAGQQ